MKHHLLIVFLAGLLLISCKKDKESKSEFQGITLTDEQGINMGYIDTTDWRTDDTFTIQEMQLFDTLDFKQVDQVKSTSGILNTSIGSIVFYPNPTTQIGKLDIGFENFIFSIQIVDNEYNKLISYRGTDIRSLAFHFEYLDPGIYRAYYVLQDLQFNIIGLGHGDVKKE